MAKRKQTSSKLKERLPDHLIQGFVVFASVFLAFWLTEIRDNAKSRREVKTALESLAMEMTYNHDRIVQTFGYHTEFLTRIDSLAGKDIKNLESYGYQIGGWQGIQLPMLRSTAYKTIVSSGLISRLPFAVQKSLADIYTIQALVEDADKSTIALALNDLESARLAKIRHLFGIYTDVLPDVMVFYQYYGSDVLEQHGYVSKLDDGILKGIVDLKIQEMFSNTAEGNQAQ